MEETIRVGTILIENRPLLLRALDLQSDSYADTWGVLRTFTSPTLDQKLHEYGWNCFFMAGEVKATALGTSTGKTIRKALTRIFARMREPDFNCLEVTRIIEDRFLGMPYITVCAHSRHIRQGWLMEPAELRKN